MKKTIDFLQVYIQSFAHLLYPRNCALCQDSLLGNEKTLCFKCIQKLPLNYTWLKENHFIRQKFIGRFDFHFSSAFMNFSGGGAVQQLMHSIKYKQDKELALFLGALFAKHLQQSTWINNIDFLIPIPLHEKRERMRGYNQAQLIAAGMSPILNIPIGQQLVIRAINNVSQTTKKGLERLENVQNAFELRDKQLLKGKHVLLIDDVLTTGSTIESCALTLSAIKSIKISTACLAIVDQ